MQKPAETVMLRMAAGEALLAQARQRHVPRAETETVAQIIRRYFWLVCALQEAQLRVKRLRPLLVGKRCDPSRAGGLARAHPSGWR